MQLPSLTRASCLSHPSHPSHPYLIPISSLSSLSDAYLCLPAQVAEGSMRLTVKDHNYFWWDGLVGIYQVPRQDAISSPSSPLIRPT